jgi:hypothetical protein
MNQMHFGAGLAEYGRVIVLRIIRNVRQPMLHVDTGLRTGEYDVPAMSKD